MGGIRASVERRTGVVDQRQGGAGSAAGADRAGLAGVVYHAVDSDPARGKRGWEEKWHKRYTAGVPPRRSVAAVPMTALSGLSGVYNAYRALRSTVSGRYAEGGGRPGRTWFSA